MLKRSNFYPNGEIIDFFLPQSFRKSLTKEACGNCGLYIRRSDVASVVDGEAKVLKITMFATNGEKGSFKDNFMIFSLLWLNTKIKLLNLINPCVEMLRSLKYL
jgi:hypothetical protein